MTLPIRADDGVEGRILGAAFAVFTTVGYAAASTLDIATRARVSKRDLYAKFGSKHGVLVACIKRRTERMGLAAKLPQPRSRQMLAETLTAYATTLVRQISDPAVVATFRLAVAEASRSPEIARTLDSVGRGATRRALAELFASAQSSGLIGSGEPDEMAWRYLGLLWEGLMVGLLMGVDATPSPSEAAARAARATSAFMQLYPAPGADG